HDGRVFSTGGDSVLAEFGSAVEAVRCAVSCQEEISSRNAELADDRKLMFRIGINVGDVMVRDGDLFGDGVNVAARLEGLAEAGGVCISGSVFEQIKHKLSLGFEDMGQQEVKNIAEPVSAYRLVPGQASAAATTATKPSDGKRWRMPAIALVVAVLFAIVGGALWWQPWAPDVEPASLEKMVLPLPDKPSIAVLPFDNMSGDSEQAYFADGMTDDLITGLSKLSGLFVISRSSTFTYKGKPVKVRQVAEELGVRYVLEGSVRRVGDQVRINAQLIDALSGYHVWAEKYDGSLADIFALQDKVVGQIVAALAVTLTSAESAQSGEAETDVPQAYDALLQGWELYNRWTPQDFTKALSHFERAIELDPGYSRAYAGLAAVYWNIVTWGWASYTDIEWQHALNRAKDYVAKALEQPTADAYRVSAELLLWQGDHDEALAEIDRAIALDPNAARNYVSKAWILTVSGRAEEAEEKVRLAMRLNPSYRPNYLRALGRALFHQERYEKAAEALERAANRQPDYEYTYVRLAAAYGNLGRIEDAKAAVEKYNEVVGRTGYRSLTVQEIRIYLQSRYHYEETYLERILDGLRKAGVSEGAAPGACLSCDKNPEITDTVVPAGTDDPY
ncbi:MAG: adenylate/guanylate cyclase domain-containing protein, partial [Alphaproteobacteria bacterium]|nr:adenylate/guanylate cyclase domain-containing protein [Alphaproteobacteria bacterium]